MIRIETREHVKSIVNRCPDGISLTHLHNRVYRMMTRLQLRTALTALYMKGEISRERLTVLNRRETKYFPFNGKQPVKRKVSRLKKSSGKILSMKDFMPGKKYRAYLDF